LREGASEKRCERTQGEAILFLRSHAYLYMEVVFFLFHVEKKTACLAQRNTGDTIKLGPGRSRAASGPVFESHFAVLASPLNEDH